MSFERVRFSQSFLNRLEESNNGKKQAPVAVIGCNQYDSNGVFSSVPTQALILQIAKMHRVFLKIIEDVKSFKILLREIGKQRVKPHLLLVMGHGYSDKILFGKSSGEDNVYDEKAIDSKDFEGLDARTIIVLYSCSTGQILAQKIADVSGRTILAPKETLYDLSTCLLRRGSGELRFASYNSLNQQHMYTFRRSVLPDLVTRKSIDDPEIVQAFEEIISFVQKVALEGDSEAQCKLGILYGQRRIQSEQSEHEAVKWFQLAAKNNGLAQLHLGYFYFSGRGGLLKSEKRALQYFRLAADRGIAEAQYLVGLFYLKGLAELTQSYEQAAYYFSLSGKQCFPEAIYNLGVLYEFGQGVPQSFAKAKSLYELASAAGISAADERLRSYQEMVLLHSKQKVKEASLGILYREIDKSNSYKNKKSPVAVIIRGKYDPNKALGSASTQALILQIAKTHRIALKVIEDAKSFGLSIREAKKETGKKISLLVVMSHGTADYFQFDDRTPWYWIRGNKRCLYEKRHVLTEDFSPLLSKAKIFLYACSAGQGIAQYISDVSKKTVFAPKELICDGATCLQNWPNPNFRLLSYNEKNEQHVMVFRPSRIPLKPAVIDMFSEENKESFINMALYLRKEAAQGNPDAQLKLGGFYLLGKGNCAKSVQDAVYWISLAAKNGVAQAQCVMGYLYLTGQEGLERSEDKAKDWFQVAANQNNPTALLQMGLFYLEGKCGFNHSENEAFKFFKLASQQGNPQGNFYLGLMYEHGQGVSRSLRCAKQQYKIAQDKGVSEAANRLAKLLIEEDSAPPIGCLSKFYKTAHRLLYIANEVYQKVPSVSVYLNRSGLEYKQG